MNKAKERYMNMSEERYQTMLFKRRLKRLLESPEEKEARCKKFREYQREYRRRKKSEQI